MSEMKQTSIPYALIVSLVINALLLGLLVGGGIALGKNKDAGPGRGGSGEFALMRGLDSQIDAKDRRAVRKSFREAYETTRAQRREVRAAQIALQQALGAETYDEAAVRDAFQTLTTAEADLKSGLHEALATEFGRLSLAQRQALLRQQRRDFNRRGGGPRQARDRQGSQPDRRPD